MSNYNSKWQSFARFITSLSFSLVAFIILYLLVPWVIKSDPMFAWVEQNIYYQALTSVWGSLLVSALAFAFGMLVVHLATVPPQAMMQQSHMLGKWRFTTMFIFAVGITVAVGFALWFSEQLKLTMSYLTFPGWQGTIPYLNYTITITPLEGFVAFIILVFTVMFITIMVLSILLRPKQAMMQ